VPQKSVPLEQRQRVAVPIVQGAHLAVRRCNFPGLLAAHHRQSDPALGAARDLGGDREVPPSR
jgi:hypothetical protein